MKENTSVLKEEWFEAEGIDEGIYTRSKYRQTETLGFYISPKGEWFHPCKHCQAKLKTLLIEGTWILGDKSIDPFIKLETKIDEIDDSSWVTVEKHVATKEEITRLRRNDYWSNLGRTTKPTAKEIIKDDE